MRLLIITHTFPPSKHSNAKRPYYVANGALDAGWEVDIMTSNIGIPPGTCESLQHPRLSIERIEDPIIRIVQQCQSHQRHAMLVMKCINGILWPDYCASWVRQVLRRADDFSKYDRILAFIFPPSVLRTGQIEGLVGRNWIFDYQESVSPQFEMSPRGSFIQRILTPKLKRLERDTLHRAGKTIFTAESNRQAYIEADLVPEEITEHIPYFFDTEVFAGGATADPTFEVRYFGNFDLHGDRNPQTFLRAFAKFLERHPEARGQAKFLFYGNWLPAHDSFIHELKIADRCELHPPLPYEEYLKSLGKAPILLLVVSSAHNLFMPSKIVDYFGARRPILAFVPPDSEMRTVLEEAGMSDFACSEHDVEAGVRAISRLWEHFTKGCLGNVQANTSRWSSNRQIPRYLQAIEDS